MSFQDRSLQCIDCHQDFIFTAGEQEFYDRKGFKEIPKRCKPCRENRKQRRSGGFEGGEPDGNRFAAGGGGGGYHHGHSHGGGTAAAGGSRGPRELFDATCAACGAPARVPFRPAAGRPVYCRDCYANRAQGGGY